MARLQLKPLAQYPFSTELTVRTTDINYGGHLGNDRVLTLVHEARVAWLASHGWAEHDCAGTGLIMGDAGLVFKNEAFAGDLLEIEVGASGATGSGFRLHFRLNRVHEAGREVIALVENGMICFDYPPRRIMPLPSAVAELCSD